MQVEVPKGCFCNLYCKFKVGLHPDGVYGIISDPDNKRIFKNIKVRLRLKGVLLIEHMDHRFSTTR